jgi:Protein of unknown function (DUF4019)
LSNQPTRIGRALLCAAALATAHAEARTLMAQQTGVGAAATSRAIGDNVEPDAVTAATDAANRWLVAVDAGKFAESWTSAAEVFKLGVKENDWVVDLDAIRSKLGKTVIRELKTARFSTTVRGAPLTGEYVTITYLTKFAFAPLATETLVVSKEPDGEWRIAGYNIVKAPAE